MIFIVKTKEDREKALRAVEDCRSDDVMQVSIVKYKKNRSSEQNALMHKWFSIKAKQQFTDDIYEKNLAKYRFGCPILIRDDNEFSRFVDKALKHLSYIDRVSAMEYVPITSLMNTKQLTEFLENFERDAIQQGVKFPTDNHGY